MEGAGGGEEFFRQEGNGRLMSNTNIKHVDRFAAVQKEAREAGRGLWGGKNEAPQATTQEQPMATIGIKKQRGKILC